MRDEQVPEDCLECFRMRRDVIGIHGWDDYAGIGFPGSITPVAADNTHDAGADLLGQLNGANQIRADVLFQVAAADGEYEQAILSVEARAFEPLAQDGSPTFVVGARGEFAHIVGGRISFEAADFSEIIYGV